MSQSHAVHAAVINHEAFVAKRKAAMALAHDIRYWNSCRKKELMGACLQSAQSHLKASKMLLTSWENMSISLNLTRSDHSPLVKEYSTSNSIGKVAMIDDKHVYMLEGELDHMKENEPLHHLVEENSALFAQEDKNATDGMTASMQSLVDGLMVWGGRFIDTKEEAQFPNDMTMHVALEESDVGSTADDDTIG